MTDEERAELETYRAITRRHSALIESRLKGLEDRVAELERTAVKRDMAMIDEKPEVVVALWDGSSRGTLDTIKRATLAGIPIFIAPTTWEGDAV